MSLKDEFYDLVSDKENEIEEILKEKYIGSNLYSVDLSGESLRHSKNEPLESDVIAVCNYKIADIIYHYHCQLQLKVKVTRIKISESDTKVYDLEEAFMYFPNSDTDGKLHYTKNKKEIKALVNYLEFRYKFSEQQTIHLLKELDLL